MPGPGEAVVNQSPCPFWPMIKSNVCMRACMSVCVCTRVHSLCFLRTHSPHCSAFSAVQIPLASWKCLHIWPPKHKNNVHSVCNKIMLPKLSSNCHLMCFSGLDQAVDLPDPRMCTYFRDPVVNRHLHHSWAGSWKKKIHSGIAQNDEFS